MTPEFPLPPHHLAMRVESVEYAEDPMGHYELLGEEAREQILSMLPDDWTFEGKKVLDFGCGSGRVLRHFLPEAETAEFWGCDIDEPSIRWLTDNLSPPLNPFLAAPDPPLPHADGTFDLIYALSVFTHLTDTWSAWLLELRRLLSDDGLLIATYMGQGVSEWIANEPWSEDRIGMNVLRDWHEWDSGGPSTLASEWWIKAHWGRAFDLLEISDEPDLAGALGLQSWALMRKRPGSFSPDDLEAIEPGEPREVEALRHNIRQLQAEVDAERKTHKAEVEELRTELRAVIAQLEEMHAGYESSISWRATKPLRMLKRGARRGA